ncbi:MAG: M48 family metallopeptidase [Candidatus Acidiferrales bacterium]
MGRCSRIGRFALILCIFLCSAACTRGAPQTPPEKGAPAATPRAERVQGQRDETPLAVPATPQKTETEKYTLSQDRYKKAIAYSRAGYALYFVMSFFEILVLILVLNLGVAAKFRDFAESVTGSRFLQGLVYIPVLVLTLDVLDLPLRLYGHSLSLRYEQSVQRWGSWMWDWSKEELLGTAFAVILVLILYAVMRRSPRRWWLYFWIASLPIIFVIVFISPWLIDPLFNKFEPLDAKNHELVMQIEKVLQRARLEIPPERMFLMEASAKTNQVNAYVTGFGASKRVVVWDTTIQKTTIPETLFIFGHEAGHYKLGHIRNGFIFFAALLLVAFYAGFRGMHWALGRWATEWKIYGPEDWASFALFLLLLQVVIFAASPVINGFNRLQEHAADVYGLEVIHGIVPDSQEVAAHAFQVMGEIDLSDPNPPAFIRFWLYSHPPVAERLVFAHSYDPWSKGQPPKYVK